MTRLIDADALKKEIGDTRDGEPIFRETEFIRMDIVEKAIDEAPTIPNPCGKPCAFVRSNGEWTSTGIGTICSVCGEYLPFSDEVDYETNFCPNCGADMRKQKEGEMK